MSRVLAILLLAALLPVSTPKERHLRQQYDDVAARASALIGEVDRMEADLQQQGLSLHPEIKAARDSLQAAMDSAADARAREDWDQLRKDLDRARGWIDRLRRLL
jgi:hypothetical protein